MKLTGKKIKSMLLCMMLTMAMAITAVGCGSKTEGTADAQKNTETAIVNTETIVETEAVAETESIETAEAQDCLLYTSVWSCGSVQLRGIGKTGSESAEHLCAVEF